MSNNNAVSSQIFSLFRGNVSWARIGTTHLVAKNNHDAQDFEIIDINYHKKYKPPSKYNDIALLKLNASVNLLLSARPACVNTETNFDSTNLTATGWGKLEYLGDTSNDLMKVNLIVYDNEKCNSHYKDLSQRVLQNGIEGKSQLCAGGSPDMSKDTCQVKYCVIYQI